MKFNSFLLLALLCINHFTTATNDAEEIHKKISQSIGKNSPRELLNVTNNLEDLQKLKPEQWLNYLKKAELNYDVIWYDQKIPYRIIKCLSLFILYIDYSYVCYNLARFGRLDREDFACFIMPAFLLGSLGLLKSWKSDKAYNIIKVLKKRIEILGWKIH